jgi:hypothetical protein
MGDYHRLRKELREWPASNGVTMIDVLNMPSTLSSLVRQMLRNGLTTPAEFGHILNVSQTSAETLAQLFVDKGIVARQVTDEGLPAYRVILLPAKAHDIPEV